VESRESGDLPSYSGTRPRTPGAGEHDAHGDRPRSPR